MNRSQSSVVSVTTYSEAGIALMRLKISGYTDPKSARALVAAGFVKPERILVQLRTFPSKAFDGMAWTREGRFAIELLDTEARQTSSLTETHQFTAFPELPDSHRVVTARYLKWLATDNLSALDRRFAYAWHPTAPREPTNVIEISLPRIKPSRRKILQRLARSGEVDPDFDAKPFMDEMWDERPATPKPKR